jgi:myo-inositol-1(or 4)-monophosphatase
MQRSAILNVMVKAATKAGRSLKRDLGEVEHLQVSLKGPRNFVTAADRKAEEIVYEELAKARPDYGFLGEEGGARAGTDKSHRWIVDPLDGTTNFLHGIPHFAVSIALERDGAIVAALTYNPANDDLFVAERGKGAFLNDRRIRVAARTRMADAVVACGLPHYGRGDLALGRHEIAAAQNHFAGLRRFGAATLDLAWIAAGRFDAFWERDLSPWDMAAGILLIREAGGFVSDADGGEAILTKGSIVAGNETMHRELLRLLQEAVKEHARDPERHAAPGPAKAAAAAPGGRGVG